MKEDYTDSPRVTNGILQSAGGAMLSNAGTAMGMSEATIANIVKAEKYLRTVNVSFDKKDGFGIKANLSGVVQAIGVPEGALNNVMKNFTNVTIGGSQRGGAILSLGFNTGMGNVSANYSGRDGKVDGSVDLIERDFGGVKLSSELNFSQDGVTVTGDMDLGNGYGLGLETGPTGVTGSLTILGSQQGTVDQSGVYTANQNFLSEINGQDVVDLAKTVKDREEADNQDHPAKSAKDAKDAKDADAAPTADDDGEDGPSGLVDLVFAGTAVLITAGATFVAGGSSVPVGGGASGSGSGNGGNAVSPVRRREDGDAANAGDGTSGEGGAGGGNGGVTSSAGTIGQGGSGSAGNENKPGNTSRQGDNAQNAGENAPSKAAQVTNERNDQTPNSSFVDLPKYKELNEKLDKLKGTLEKEKYTIKEKEYIGTITENMKTKVKEFVKTTFGDEPSKGKNDPFNTITEAQKKNPDKFKTGEKVDYPTKEIMETESNQRTKAEGEKYQRAITKELDKHIDKMAGDLKINADVIKAISSVESKQTLRSGYNLDGSLNVRVELANLKKSLESIPSTDPRNKEANVLLGKIGNNTFDGKALGQSKEGQEVHQSIIKATDSNPQLKELVLQNTSMGAFHIYGGDPKLSGNTSATQMFDTLSKANQNPKVQVNMMKTFIEKKGALKKVLQRETTEPDYFKKVAEEFSGRDKGETYGPTLETEYNNLPK